MSRFLLGFFRDLDPDLDPDIYQWSWSLVSG